MTVFVTGGTGFIGGHFLRSALAGGLAVRALRRPGSRPVVPLAGEPEWVEGDMGGDWEAALRGCAVLVHLAAAGVSPKPITWQQAYESNVTNWHRLLDAARRASVRRVVACGSCFEYGMSGRRYEFIPPDAPLEPIGPYASSKAAATMVLLGFAQEHALEAVLLRPFHLYGEGTDPRSLWGGLVAAARSGADLPMTPGQQVRDYMPVEAVAKEFVRWITDPRLKAGEPVVRNIGSGRPVTLEAFAREWWERLGATGRLRVGELPYRPNEVMRYVPDIRPLSIFG